MMKVHGAAMGFEMSADAYQRGRPSYPRAAIDFLAGRLGRVDGATVLDIGAGTGKLSPSLVRIGARVIGLEPIAGIRRKFAEMFPAREILGGSAESIPLPDGSLDAACASQGLHWFANPAALAEIRRVLKPNSRLGLIWNRLDRSSGWVRETKRIIDRLKGDAPKYEDSQWRRASERLSSFKKSIERTFSHVQTADRPTVLDRFGSTSHVA